MFRRYVLCLVVAASAATFAVDMAQACSPLGYPAHTVAPAMQGIDTQAPTLAPIPEPTLTRRLTDDGGCGPASKCPDPGGYLMLSVHAADDMSEPAEIGYRLSITEGTPPAGFRLPVPNPIAVSQPNAIFLRWFEGEELEAFDFTLSVVAVDRAGNESAPQTVHIQDPGDAGGCRIGARRHANVGTGLIALLALAFAAHRRRARHA
jgi:hypothetical protein